MKYNILRILVAALFFVLPTSAHAEYDPDACENVGMGLGHFLRKGDVASCTGDQVPAPELQRLLKIETDYDTALKEVESLKKTIASDAVLCQKRLDGTETARRECEAERVPPPPVYAWYQTTTFKVVVTAVLATAVGTAFGVALTK